MYGNPMKSTVAILTLPIQTKYLPKTVQISRKLHEFLFKIHAAGKVGVMIYVPSPATHPRMQDHTLRPLFHATASKVLATSYCVITLSLLAIPAKANPLLRCYATYAGETQIIKVQASTDPYQIESIDIGGRFKFKAEMNGELNVIHYIKIYAYFQTNHGDIPIHEASYYPPFTLQSTEFALTPHNRLYAGPLERELQYYCTLQEKK